MRPDFELFTATTKQLCRRLIKVIEIMPMRIRRAKVGLAEVCRFGPRPKLA
jgi:hypothetical protein